MAIFGLPGADLAGDSLSVTYTVNPSLLAANGFYQHIGSTYESLIDGSNDNALSDTIGVNNSVWAATTDTNSLELFGAAGHLVPPPKLD